MTRTGALQVTTPSDREITMTRVFAAPRTLVFEALTRPELVRRWLGALEGWTFEVCEIDARPGGSYRYLWRHHDGSELGMRGTYLEVLPPERIVSTEVFDQSWYEGEAVGTVVLTSATERPRSAPPSGTVRRRSAMPCFAPRWKPEWRPGMTVWMSCLPAARVKPGRCPASMHTITPFLRFDGQAEEAMTFYVSVFRNSKVLGVMPGPDGGVMSVSFELDGQRFHALNGGPHFRFAPAISLFVSCETQAEVDERWENLASGRAVRVAQGSLRTFLADRSDRTRPAHG